MRNGVDEVGRHASHTPEIKTGGIRAGSDAELTAIAVRKGGEANVQDQRRLESTLGEVKVTRTVLFLCTGNYYRSRFAEGLFDHLALSHCPGWAATSRALDLSQGSGNVGPISRFASDRLRRLGIARPSTHRMPMQLVEAELDAADHIVALDRTEHRPLLDRRFADWAARHGGQVEFWDVGDIALLAPDQALTSMEAYVTDLCWRLSAGL